ncbi:hypothetical protein [Methylobacterium sp. WSM2598]|uniref:hypothetical protein n=1 Tax=Methylobacterium sp. WSM2598 TaxID=398261 RepID=UPI000382CB8D|nr:hypothetical protein [Methylobacterium sp. WSM2598]
MREVDPRRRVSRRSFLQSAAAAAPAAAIASGAGLCVEEAWAEGAAALTPSDLKTLVKIARDIYPHDFLADSSYIAAVKPWDAKAAADPATRQLLTEGIRRLDEDARTRHKVPYAQVGWEADRVVLLQAVAHTPFFKALRADLVVSLYNQPDLWAKFGYEGSSADKGGYIARGFNDIDWLPKV